MDYLSISSAAKIKGISRGAVTQAVAANKIHQTMINDIPHILANRAFENWKPKRSKSDEETRLHEKGA